MAIVGHDLDNPDQIRMEIGDEWPVSVFRPLAPVDQFEMEWLHAQRFRTDHVLGTGIQPFINIRPGAIRLTFE